MGVKVNYRIYNMEIRVFVLRGRGHGWTKRRRVRRFTREAVSADPE